MSQKVKNITVKNVTLATTFSKLSSASASARDGQSYLAESCASVQKGPSIPG